MTAWTPNDTLPDESGLYWAAGEDDGGWPCVSLFEVGRVPDPKQGDVSPLDMRFIPATRRADGAGYRWLPGLSVPRMTHWMPCPRPAHPRNPYKPKGPPTTNTTDPDLTGWRTDALPVHDPDHGPPTRARSVRELGKTRRSDHE